MSRDQILAAIREHEADLRTDHGVRTLTLFGSLARDEAKDTSDVDLIVEFDRPTGYFGLVRLQLFLQTLLGQPVDLGTPGSLRPGMRQRIAQESLRVA
jgi:uncharacterized protein